MSISKVSLLSLAAVLVTMMGTALALGTRRATKVMAPISTAFHQGHASTLVGRTCSQLRCYRKIKHMHSSRSVTASSSTMNMMSNNDDDSENESKIRQPIKPSTSTAWDSPQSLVGSLLEKTTSRAFRTLSDNSATSYEDSMQNPNINDVIEATISRGSSTLDEKEESVTQGKPKSSDDREQSNNTKLNTKHEDKRTYLGNPSVTPTALAHSLWKSTILPHQDTVIDATCGNGKDCLALAKMLFPTDDDDANCQQDAVSPQPQLIGIDIQARAIANTQRSVLSSLPSEIYYNHISILKQSHEHLMNVPADKQSVGLVCYNLGYLPGGTTDNYKETQTQTQTTLNSITDASLLLRVGGLLSVMTYPGSNLEESRAVEHFAEGLAMLTTRDVGGWRGYVDSIPDYDNGGSIRETVSRALERVVAEGSKKQTWRVFLHKPLGRPLSPVLVTAMRIK